MKEEKGKKTRMKKKKKKKKTRAEESLIEVVVRVSTVSYLDNNNSSLHVTIEEEREFVLVKILKLTAR